MKDHLLSYKYTHSLGKFSVLAYRDKKLFLEKKENL